MGLSSREQRRIGPFGVGPVGFGCWRFSNDRVDESGAILNAALDLGINLIDCADVYGYDWGGQGFGENEAILGRIIAAEAVKVRLDREDVYALVQLSDGQPLP